MRRLTVVATLLVTFCTTEPEPCQPQAAYVVGGGSEVQCVPPDCDESCYAS